MRDAPRDEKPTVEQEAQSFYDAVFDDELRKLLDQADEGDDEARESIESMAYGIEKRVTYYVTLAGGGPAARLVIEASLRHGDVERAWLEYQDWFTLWTPAPMQDSDLVERFAAVVGYYGE
jgi:hypothetical protein